MVEIFETGDLDEAEAILRAAYGTLHVHDRGSGGPTRVTHTPVGYGLRLDHLTLGMDLDIVGDPLGVLIVGELHSGRLAHRSAGHRRLWRPGDLFLAAQPDHRWTDHLIDIDATAAVITPALFAQVLDLAPDRAPAPLRFTGHRPVSPQAAAVWRNTYAYVHHLTRSRPDLTDEPLLVGAAARLLAGVTMATFPTTAPTDPDAPTAADRHDAHPATLRRAVAYIDAHAHTDITPADIATAAAVSVRALRLAFRRHLDTTPTAYLHRVRLAHAHHDLRHADVGTGAAHTTIAAIAARWGFPHPDRFALLYHRAYGVTPHHTLHH